MEMHKQPQLGSHIKITWLPPCVNARTERNPYIDMSGIVDYLYDNGGFCLNTGSSILCVTQRRYRYIKIE